MRQNRLKRGTPRIRAGTAEQHNDTRSEQEDQSGGLHVAVLSGCCDDLSPSLPHSS